MKNKIFYLIFFMCSIYLQAQIRYTVNGETLELETEIEGDLDLLILKLKGKDRYFIKDGDDHIYELLNTKISRKNYKQEYKEVLAKLIKGSNMSVDDASYGRYGLSHFIKAYNSRDQVVNAYSGESVHAKSRLAIFGGLTNHPFIENNKNNKNPFFGLEFEFLGDGILPRQSGFINVSHALESTDFKYSLTEFALGYRYRFINKTKFNIYVNLKIATFDITKLTVQIPNEADQELSDSGFSTPLAFGLGADLKISDTNYITVIYNSLVAVFSEHNGNFPVDLAVGYKFNL